MHQRPVQLIFCNFKNWMTFFGTVQQKTSKLYCRPFELNRSDPPSYPISCFNEHMRNPILSKNLRSPNSCKTSSNYYNFMNGFPCHYDSNKYQAQYDLHQLFITNKLQNMPLDLTATQAEMSLFERLNDFISMHEIPLSSFWKSNRLCLTLEQFMQLLEGITFKVSYHELQRLSADNVEFINLASLIDGVQFWKMQEQSVSSFISKQQQVKEAEDTKKNIDKSGISNLRLNTATSRITAKQRTTDRSLQAEVKLTQTLIKAKNESDYELTIKVGEVNDICKSLKNQFSFLIDSASSQTKIIEINSKSGEQKTIKLKVFQKRYEQFKTQSLSKGQEFEGTLEDDLKKTLVEVMCLSDQLEQQIRLLEAKGVTH